MVSRCTLLSSYLAFDIWSPHRIALVIIASITLHIPINLTIGQYHVHLRKSMRLLQCKWLHILIASQLFWLQRGKLCIRDSRDIAEIPRGGWPQSLASLWTDREPQSNAVIERGKTWKHSAPDLHDCQTCTHAALLENYKDTVLKGRQLVTNISSLKYFCHASNRSRRCHNKFLEVLRLTLDLVLND